MLVIWIKCLMDINFLCLDVKHFVCLGPIATREQMWIETMNMAFLNSNDQTSV